MVSVSEDIVPEPIAAPVESVAEPIAAPIEAVPESTAAPADVVPEPISAPVEAVPEPTAAPADVVPEPISAPVEAVPEPIAAPVEEVRSLRRVTDDEWRRSSESIYTEACVSADTILADSIDGGEFNMIAGGADSWKDAAIAPDGTIWAIAKNNYLWYYRDGAWTYAKFYNSLKKVSVDSNGDVYCIGSNGELFYIPLGDPTKGTRIGFMEDAFARNNKVAFASELYG